MSAAVTAYAIWTSLVGDGSAAESLVNGGDEVLARRVRCGLDAEGRCVGRPRGLGGALAGAWRLGRGAGRQQVLPDDRASGHGVTGGEHHTHRDAVDGARVDDPYEVGSDLRHDLSFRTWGLGGPRGRDSGEKPALVAVGQARTVALSDRSALARTGMPMASEMTSAIIGGFSLR